MKRNIFKRHKHEFMALFLFLVGGFPAMLGLIQKVPIIVGIAGVVLLTSGMFYYCLKLVAEEAYKDYYKQSYEVEHETIEEEIRRSMQYHRYQEAIIGRYESACRDLGLSEEQKDWLMELLMAEKDKVDVQMKEEGRSTL
jgi:hypothetical protein